MFDTAKSEVLKNALIFSSLNDKELAEIAERAVERSFRAGEFVFWEDDPPDYFYVLLEGNVKVVKHSSSGKDFVVAFFSPGDMFGEVAVFENKPYPASAQAVNEVKVLAINTDALLKFLSLHPQVAIRIISVLGGRLRESQSRLRDIASEKVEQRIARTLLMLSDKLGNTLPFTRQEIADMTGTTTETAIRVMSRLKEGGIISSVRGQIVILDEAKLKLLSEGPPRVD
ncbi:MAG: Crp/Fnr family transcriptional regulator [Chloroflexi bacterium]|nr:Crp/Fnr family transcriptional regulator [Chloroflexota bacterium]